MKALSLESLKMIFDILQNGIYIVDNDFNIVYFNNKALINTKYKRKELLGLGISKISKKLKKEIGILQDLSRKEKIIKKRKFNDIHLNKQESMYHVKSEVSMITIDGEDLYLVSSINVNEDREKELATLEMNEIIMDSQSIGKFGSWTWYLNTDEIVWTDEVYKIFGEDKDSFQPDFNTFLTYLSKEDIDKVNEEVAKKLADNDYIYQVQYDINLNNGEVKHVQETGKVYYDENGDQEKMVGTVFDITNSVLNERELSKINSFLENIINTINEEIVVFDKHLNILLSNNISNNKIDPEGNKLKKRAEIAKLVFEDKVEIKANHIVKEKDGNSFKYVSLTYQEVEDEDSKINSIVEISHDITNLMNTQQELENKANYDNLTELANRNLFSYTLTNYINEAAVNDETVALFFIDLDSFKAVNDTLGHDVGDDVLVTMADVLRGIKVEEDMLPVRLGGDEFTIIVKNQTIEQIEDIARYINKHTNIPITTDAGTINVSTSIGISIYPTISKNEDDLLKDADVAMYDVKNNGKNNFVIFKKED